MQTAELHLYSLGDRIRQARKAIKLTQRTLAKDAGISVVSLNRFEMGHRSPKTDVLMKLAALLKCNSQWLVTGEEENVPESGLTDDFTKNVATNGDYIQDPVLMEIIQILENYLPEAKEQVLKILIARKQMKEGLNALGLTGN
jgi:transcriptional regulator with XRE-family HTH domain